MHYAYEYNKRVVRDKNCNNPLNQKPGLYRIISSSQDASPTQEYSVPANMKNAASVLLLLASTTTLTFAHHEANNGVSVDCRYVICHGFGAESDPLFLCTC